MAEPASAAFAAELAAALHAGHSWDEIADRVGQPVRAFRRVWRPKVRRRILERVGPADPPHGSWERAGGGRRRHGGCYADGRLCDPCLGAIGGYQARRRAEDAGRVRLPVDPDTVELLAKRLHAGDTWVQLAAQAGVTVGFYQRVYRPLVQARCLELVSRDDSPGPGEPGHGTYWRYADARWACRCEPCRYAVVVYARQRTLGRRRGPAYVDAVPARAHVLRLSAQGVGWKQVARQAGVSNGAVTKLLYGDHRRGPSRRIRAGTEARLLAVRPAVARLGGQRVPAQPTHALVAVLVANGWTKRAISAAIGQDGRALQLGREYVTVRNAAAVRELWETWPHPPAWARRRSRWDAPGSGPVGERHLERPGLSPAPGAHQLETQEGA